jgi:hypothetical protein
MTKETNELRVLREFLQEFNPIYADVGVLFSMSYRELVDAVKETVKEM